MATATKRAGRRTDVTQFWVDCRSDRWCVLKSIGDGDPVQVTPRYASAVNAWAQLIGRDRAQSMDELTARKLLFRSDNGKVVDLRRAKRQATIQDSKKKESDMTPRPKKTRDLTTYSARVSHALEQFRKKRHWTVEDLQAAIKAAGGPEVPVSTLYAYELGKANKGVDVPLNLFPAIAKALGYKSAAGWLPGE